MKIFNEIPTTEYCDYFIRIHVNSIYTDKNKLKQLGARWNPKTYSWYFQYMLNEFIEDETLHSYNFTPDDIVIVDDKRSSYNFF